MYVVVILNISLPLYLAILIMAKIWYAILTTLQNSFLVTGIMSTQRSLSRGGLLYFVFWKVVVIDHSGLTVPYLHLFILRMNLTGHASEQC